MQTCTGVVNSPVALKKSPAIWYISGEIIDLGVDYEIVKKSGSWFSYGETKLGQGREAVKQLLVDNPELSDELEAKIVEKLNGQ